MRTNVLISGRELFPSGSEVSPDGNIGSGVTDGVILLIFSECIQLYLEGFATSDRHPGQAPSSHAPQA